MRNTLLLILALLLGCFECSHFRGGQLSWSANPGSNKVTFSLQTFWNATDVQNTMVVNYGDGTTEPITFPTTNSFSDYATVSGKWSHTYTSTGTYSVYIGDCCRIQSLRAGGNQPFKVQTTVILTGAYVQSPVISIPAILDFGVGYNSFPIISSVPIDKWVFSPSIESGLLYSVVTGIFNNYAQPPGPKIITVSGEPKIALFTWNTTAKDVGQWAVQIKAVTSSGSVAADFLVRVGTNSIKANPTVIEPIPADKLYGLTLGETAKFKVTCSAPTNSNSKFLLYTSVVYPGLKINGDSNSTVYVDSGVAVSIEFTPDIQNGAGSQAYVLNFVCRNIQTYISDYTSIVVYVSKPLEIKPVQDLYVQCHPHCGCIEIDQPEISNGCCGIPSITYTDVGEGSCNSYFKRTWVVTNNCGQKASLTQTIYVNDTIPPDVDDSSLLDLEVQCYYDSDVLITGSPFATDTCSENVDITYVDTGDTGNCKNVIKRRFTATDECGNYKRKTQIITVDDTTPPYLTINTELPLKVECPADAGFFDGIVTAIDNCDSILNVTFCDTPKNVVCGQYNRTYKAEDSCGNSADLTLALEISHKNKPTMVFASYYNTPKCKSSVKHVPAPTATSYCGKSLNVTLVSIDYTRSGKCYTGANRTWTATDECGNCITKSEFIPIADTTRPHLYEPNDTVLECVWGVHCPVAEAEMYSPAHTGGYARATDNCGQTINVTYTDVKSKGACTDTITRTWRAVDRCGNYRTQKQLITIVDKTPPEVSPPLNFDGTCPADIKYALGPKINGDCHDTFSSYTDKILSESYTCTDRKVERTYTVSDVCYNSVKLKQIITISDKTPPQITVPCNAVVECKDKANWFNVTGKATGKDNCGKSVAISFVDDVHDNYLIRIWTATDVCGNWVSKNQTIAFNNSKPFLECPADITVDCIESSHPDHTGLAKANDLCTGKLVPTYEDTTKSTCPTVIERKWTAYDATTKQSAVCRQYITVGNTTGPCLKEPRDTSVECVYLAVPENTGAACASVVCPSSTYTNPNYTDKFSGNPCEPDYTITRTWRTWDECNFLNAETQKIIIYDNTKPVLSVPPTCIATCRYNIDVAACGNATAWDNCDADGNPLKIKYSDNIEPSKVLCPPTVTRTWTATDCTGNSATGYQTITIDESGPVFLGEPESTLPDIDCEECLDFPTPEAQDACGNDVDVTYKIKKTGTCPTTFTITWTATDTCGRQATLVQTVVARDTISPNLNTDNIDYELYVECDADIPVFGHLTASDNCPGVGTPVYVDSYDGNCTCASCSKRILRTWHANDRCGNPSKTFTQTIYSQKTKPPTLNLPKDYTIKCGQSYEADITGTGKATAKDSCGAPLYVSYSDATVTNIDGSMTIKRTWTASDNCKLTTTGVQEIKVLVDDYDKGYTISIPADRDVPCGGDIYAEDNDYPTISSEYYNYKSTVSVSGKCGVVTVDHSLQEGCPQAPGKYVREWRVRRNGVLIDTLYQTITVQACTPSGPGIIRIPKYAGRVPTDSTVTPTITVIQPSLPCDVITTTWIWGDNRKDTIVCNPDSLNAYYCKLNGTTLVISGSHTYTEQGVYDIQALVQSQQSTNPDSDYGIGYVRFHATYITVDPYSGYVSGSVDIVPPTNEPQYSSSSSYDDSESAQTTNTCNKPWIIKSLPYGSTDNSYVDVTCSGGYPKVSVSAKFTKDNETVKAAGDTTFSWSTCAGGLLFSSTNLTHLSLFADGSSALWTGFGSYSLAPQLGQIPFTLYAIDGARNAGSFGDLVHLRVSDNSGVVLLDTDTCMGPITDYTEKPSSVPSSVLADSSVGFDIMNSADAQVSAIGSEDSTTSKVPIGLIVGIVIGLLLFIVGVAAGVYYLLKRSSVGGNISSDTFVSMK